MYLHARLEFAGCRGESAVAALRSISTEKQLSPEWLRLQQSAAGLKMQKFARRGAEENGNWTRSSSKFYFIAAFVLLGAKKFRAVSDATCDSQSKS